MKLLPTFVLKDKQQEELTRKIIRTQEINALLKDAESNLARAQEDFNTTLAQNRAKWALEEEEHSKRVLDMEQEIKTLETRKQQALTPLQIYKDEADRLLLEAQDIVTKAKEKDEQSDYLQEKLEERLSEVADREQRVAFEEQRQQIARQGIDEQQKLMGRV